ncbi:MAG: hypothetical protein H0W30_01320 [Gemmatimonadaceae bacterium]|nr:hypothetical protein [Gemmatimonadaceae bacterium]MBA3557216.1 hypothetical protein [Gemmatimonadaceae bacterium]
MKPFIKDEPHVSRSVSVSADAEHAERSHDVQITLCIYDNAGRDPLISDVLVTVDSRRWVNDTPAREATTASLELSVYELEPIAAALSRAVAVAKEKGFIQPPTQRMT